MNKKLLATSWIGNLIGAICITDITNIIIAIFGCISLLLSIMCSIINIVQKIKKATADGVVTVEELEDIKKEVEKTEDIINDKIRETKNNDQ